GIASAASDIRRHRRGSVRLLHARLPTRRQRTARAEREAFARRDQGSPERKLMPLHRLYKNLRGRRTRRRADAGRRGGASRGERLRLRINFQWREGAACNEQAMSKNRDGNDTKTMGEAGGADV